MKNQNRKKFLSARANDDEHERIHAAALASGNMDISDYVRRCALLGIVFKVEAKVPEEIQLNVESMSFEKPGSDHASQKSRRNGSG